MYFLSRLINNYSFAFGKKYMLFSILLIIIGWYFNFKYFIITGSFILFITLFTGRRPMLNKIIDEDFLFSPCFGRIMKIKKVNNMLQIAIYVRLKDPHVQYVPYSGKIIKQIYKKGTFKAAKYFEKSEHNEKLIHNIQTNKGLITVAQIGGVLARSIHKFVNEGDYVEQNQELGYITFTGSRVDVFIPLENKYDVLVKEGDKVTNYTALVKFKKL